MPLYFISYYEVTTLSHFFEYYIMAENTICMTIPFLSSDSADLAHEILNVDEELKRSGVQRDITVSGVELFITLHGSDLKRIRVALNGILQNILLIAKTVELFKD